MINIEPKRFKWYATLMLLLAAGWIWFSAASPAQATNGLIPAPQAGFLAPDFTLETLSGDSITLSALRGKPVIINLWASWCGPCRAEMPAMQRAYEQFSDGEAEILAVNATNQDSISAATAFASELGLTFPILLDVDGAVSDLYHLRALPSTFFVDADGVIREVVIGGPMAEALLLSRVDQLLQGALMLPVLQIGPLAIQTPGLIVLIGLWVGLSLAEKFAPEHKINPEDLYNLVLTAILAGVVGGRLAYAAQYSSAFLASPGSLISINPGLFDPVGGAAIALLASIIYAQRKSLAARAVLDALTPLFAALTIAVGLSNLASGRGSWIGDHPSLGAGNLGAVRHPTQVYDALVAGLILFALWPGRFNFRKFTTGIYFASFVIYTAAARLFLEAFRGDSTVLPNGMRTEQLAAWLILALGLWGFHALGSTPSSKKRKE